VQDRERDICAREAALEAREASLTAREKQCIETQESCRKRCLAVLANADAAKEEVRGQVLHCTAFLSCVSWLFRAIENECRLHTCQGQSPFSWENDFSGT
jgi:hypothetical protein